MGDVVNDLKPFDLGFKFTVQNEGNFSDQAHDRGGPTNYGVTQSTLSLWLGRPASVNEVKHLDLGVAKQIYYKHYWLPLGLDSFKHTGCAMAMFDIGVVRGIAVPPKYAQLVANEFGNTLVVDGHLGPISLDAINAIAAADFLHGFHDLVRQGFDSIVRHNPSQARFKNGWDNRADRLLTLAKVSDVYSAPDLSLVKS